jgi:hypothetical protein
MVAIRFTGNYEDLSTDRGYQFKFFCEKCNNGYMSSFNTSTVGVLSSAARVAGSLFGGVFGSVANSSYEVQRAIGGPAHDSALKEAVDEISPIFKQCTRCGNWSASRCAGTRKPDSARTARPTWTRSWRQRRPRRRGNRCRQRRARWIGQSSARSIRSPARSAHRAARSRRAASSVPNAAPHTPRKRNARDAVMKPRGRRSSVRSAGESISKKQRQEIRDQSISGL